MVCKIKECNDPIKAKELCSKHYRRFNLYGDPNVIQNKRNTKIDFVEENGCFVVTTLTKDKYGYFHITRKGKHTLVHRFIYEQCFGEIEKGLVVRHKCDNPSCINPEHLELGTFLDNMNDKIKRGRVPKGEQNGISKLKENEVLEIKQMILSGKSLGEISAKFNISKSTVCDIRVGRSWKHLSIS